jgi:NAD(P)-dependent dehydrogenase (short-subunit alcohol dehydrogenase family)
VSDGEAVVAEKRVAVVTGASRGIGLEVAKGLAAAGLKVVVTGRDAKAVDAAVAEVQRSSKGGEAVGTALDVRDDASVEAFSRWLASHAGGRVDVLVNNAGILPDNAVAGDFGSASAFEAPLARLRDAFETNTLGPFALIQRFAPGMRERKYGRIVNVSSGMGQLSAMDGGYPAYRLSKTALNAVTRIFARELEGTGVLVNAACPGWCRTAMGGESAPRTAAEGADTVVWLATLPDGGPTGGFFRDRKAIAW